MAADILLEAPTYKRVAIISGDNDFLPAIQSLNKRGLQTYIIGLPREASQSLRNAADHFIDLQKLLAGELTAIIEAGAAGQRDQSGSPISPVPSDSILDEMPSKQRRGAAMKPRLV